jgi:hypothetical protein
MSFPVRNNPFSKSEMDTLSFFIYAAISVALFLLFMAIFGIEA